MQAKNFYNAGCGKPKGYIMTNSGLIDQIKGKEFQKPQCERFILLDGVISEGIVYSVGYIW